MDYESQGRDRTRQIVKVSYRGIGVNLILVAFKAVVGFFAGEVERRRRLQILVGRRALVQRHVRRFTLRNLHAREVVSVAGDVMETVRAERPVGDRLTRRGGNRQSKCRAKRANHSQ